MSDSLKAKLFAAVTAEAEAEAEMEVETTSESRNAFEEVVANADLPPIREILGWRDDDERSLVHVAAAVGNVAAIQFLVGRSAPGESGGDSDGQKVEFSRVLNAKDEGGWTALLSASAAGHAQVVQVLIEEGADLSASTESGRNAFSFAASKGRIAVLKALTEADSRIAAKEITAIDKSGCTCLHRAAASGAIEAVRIVAQFSPDVDLQDKTGMSALMIAANYNHLEIVKFLLEMGANPNLEDPEGNSAADLTIEKDIREVIIGYSK